MLDIQREADKAAAGAVVRTMIHESMRDLYKVYGKDSFLQQPFGPLMLYMPVLRDNMK